MEQIWKYKNCFGQQNTLFTEEKLVLFRAAPTPDENKAGNIPMPLQKKRQKRNATLFTKQATSPKKPLNSFTNLGGAETLEGVTLGTPWTPHLGTYIVR